MKKPNNDSKTNIPVVLFALLVACLGLLPRAQAVSPAPDGGYPGQNTAEGDGTLFSLTTGLNNTAIGFNALYYNTTGSSNTANGVGALGYNTDGSANTATGVDALLSNTDGYENTANGYEALFSNTLGFANTASGVWALYSNTVGLDNTANGYQALYSNQTGDNNTANGFNALLSNTTGSNNTANGLYALYSNTTGDSNAANGAQALFGNTIGYDNTANGYATLIANTTGFQNTANGFQALYYNTTGNNNTADGVNALQNNTTGSNNIAMGYAAGGNLTTGNNNIDIGNGGVAGEANTIRIGTSGTETVTFVAGIRGVPVSGGQPVAVNASGQLGVKASSARFKEAIRPMDKASEAILALKPVTFRYKKELDPEGARQFGLVAEEVEKVNPDLVDHAADGTPFTVRYEAVNAMLLNEFLKEHRKVNELEAIVSEQQKKFHAATVQQNKEIKVLAATVKEQASQIQQVNAKIGLSTFAQRTARRLRNDGSTLKMAAVEP